MNELAWELFDLIRRLLNFILIGYDDCMTFECKISPLGMGWIILFGVIGCGSEAPEWCAEEDEVTYAEFGGTFLRQHCNGCHGSEANNRHGAPESISFDSIESVWLWKDAILRVTSPENPVMPPAWDLDEGDVALLQVWLECGSELEDQKSLRKFDP